MLELIVVMVLMALGVSLITSSLGRGFGRRRPKAFVREFAGLCRQARTQALAGGRLTSVVIDGELRLCRLEDRQAGLKIPESIRIEVEDRILDADDPSGYRILFFPDGSSSGDRLVFFADDKPLARLYLDPLTSFIRLQSTWEHS
ncbi:MAG: hypothetical protein BZ151_01860 [Desulfobacca sp. 4484_104]|nr:MAG: hypothetical protein BZ151_01860 [Desulfobacca sp. 4484_104]